MGNTEPSLLESLLNDSSFRNWAKKSNKNDVVFWNNWMKENQDKIAIAETAKSIVLGISFEKKTMNKDVLEDKLAMVLDEIKIQESARSPRPIRRLSNKVRLITAIAAVSLVLITLGFNFFSQPNDIIHKAGYGEIMDLTLPDGTSVILNGNSEISYERENPRDITLKGQAYFKVKSMKATKAKFWVNTNDLRVEVYGTQFHVNTREQKTDVLLDEGSIHLLLNNGESKEMVPGELVSFSSEKDFITHDKVTSDISYSLWREGTYEFNNIRLKEVMKFLEHTYGIPAKFSNKKLEEKTISGGIPNRNLKICLRAIEKSTGTRIEHKNDTLIIYSN